MKNIKKKLFNAFYIIVIIVCFVMIFIYGWKVGNLLKAKEGSLTQASSWGNGKWSSFEVME